MVKGPFVFSFVFVFFAGVLLVPEVARAHGEFEIDCDYPEDPPGLVRIPVEAQTWWLEASNGDGDDFGMLRHGVCLPLDLPHNPVRVTGPFRMKFHTRICNEGVGTSELYQVAVQVWGSEDKTTFHLRSGTEDYGECPPGQDCDYYNEIVIDPDRLGHTGQYEFRLHAKVRKIDGPLEGKVQFTSSGYQIFIDNGKSTAGPYRSRGQQIARGWYTDREYENAQIDDPHTFPIGDYFEPFDLTVRLDKGSGGETPQRTFVSMNPMEQGNFDAGQILYEFDGPFRGSVRIDPAWIPDGRHMIGLFTQQEGFEEGNAGIFLGGLVLHDIGCFTGNVSDDGHHDSVEDPAPEDPASKRKDPNLHEELPLTLTKVTYYRSTGNLSIAGFNAVPNAEMFVNGEFFGHARADGTFALKQQTSSPSCEFQLTDGVQVLDFSGNNGFGCTPK